MNVEIQGWDAVWMQVYPRDAGKILTNLCSLFHQHVSCDVTHLSVTSHYPVTSQCLIAAADYPGCGMGRVWLEYRDHAATETGGGGGLPGGRVGRGRGQYTSIIVTCSRGPSNKKTTTHCWVYVGPASQTVDQH